MNALASPVEPLHVDYLSYRLSTVVNNIWAWVAVITAAVGLWRIRGLSARPAPREISEVAAALTPPPKDEPAQVPTPAGRVLNRRSATAPLSTTTSCCREIESEGSPKGKFSVYYYYNDDLRRLEKDEDGGGVAVEREGLVRWRCGDDWERKVAVRMGDMGWYKCLDFKALDGSVVRLWE